MNMVNNDRIDELLESLGVVGRLTENKKLTLRDGRIDIDSYKKIQWLIRSWYKEDDRNVCLDEVKKIFHESHCMASAALQDVRILNEGQQSETTILDIKNNLRRYGRLAESLKAATYGIETQLVTYKNDDRFCPKVKNLVESTRDKLNYMDALLEIITKHKSKVNNYNNSSNDKRRNGMNKKLQPTQSQKWEKLNQLKMNENYPMNDEKNNDEMIDNVNEEMKNAKNKNEKGKEEEDDDDQNLYF